MLDSAASLEGEVRKPRVISLSSNPDLLWLREVVLRQAGFDVLSSVAPEEALLRIQAGGCDALLLCFSLPEDIQQKVARQFQQSCPGKSVIAVADHRNGFPALEFADVSVNSADGPDALIRALREAGESPDLRA